MITNILLCGVGGQGTVLASKLIAATAMEKGYEVRTAETIGMAQRGGCVVSHVRIGSEIHSPLIPEESADIIIGFEPAETVRCLHYLKENGTVIVNSRFIQPVNAALSGGMRDSEQYVRFIQHNIRNAVIVDTDEVCRRLGSYQIINTALLGAAVRTGKLPFEITDIENTVRNKLPVKYHSIIMVA